MDIKTWCDAERGRATKLAADIGVEASFIGQIVSGLRPVPPLKCVAIERATSGAVTRRDLRPIDWREIWPELITAEPEKAGG